MEGWARGASVVAVMVGTAIAFAACASFSGGDGALADADGGTVGQGEAAASSDSAPASADGGCGDLGSSARNCGACGHDCGDAGCTLGVCQNTRLLTGSVTQPGELVITGTASTASLAWTNGSSLAQACLATSCAVPATGIAAAHLGWAPQPDGGPARLYGSNVSQQLSSCVWDGSSCTSPSTFGLGGAIAGTPAGAYVVGSVLSNTWLINRFPGDGAGATAVVVDISEEPLLLSVAGSHVAFASADNVFLFTLGASQLKFDAASKIASGTPKAIAVDPQGTSVVWFDGMTLSESNAAGVATVIDSTSVLQRLAVTATHIFATTNDVSAALVRYDRKTHARLVLAGASAPAVPLALDEPGRTIYWIAGTASIGQLFATPMP